MPIFANRAGNYSTGHYMTTCGCDAYTVAVPEILEFDFPAQGLQIVNTCGDPLYFSLSTAPASTDSPSIPGGGTFQAKSLWTSGISLATTSTSTGLTLPTGRPRVSVVAWSA